jgi:flagellar hook-associated protein 1 FlgK
MNMINIGASGASAASIQLDVTAQNTANYITPGYSRQRAETSSVGPSWGESNSAGNGVQVDSICRISSQSLVSQIWSASSDSAYYNTTQQYLGALESILSSPESSLSTGFDNFFAALSAATVEPDSEALRAQIISEANALALRVNNTDNYIQSQQSQVKSQCLATIDEVNTLTCSIAGYNQQIAETEASGGNASALYDSRDQLVNQLSELVDVQVTIDEHGSYNIALPDGQPLVSGNSASSMSIVENADGSQNLQLNFAGTVFDIDNSTGGALGALFDYQQQVLIPLSDAVEGIAGAFASAVNDQLAQGYDMNGNPGQPLFIYDRTAAGGPLLINPDLDPQELALSSDPNTPANSDNLTALLSLSTQELDIPGVGVMSVGEACTDIISQIGIFSRQNQTEAQAASNVLYEAQTQASNVSGVNIDEEAINLITYSQCYQANLKVISTGAEIFDDVLQMF